MAVGELGPAAGDLGIVPGQLLPLIGLDADGQGREAHGAPIHLHAVHLALQPEHLQQGTAEVVQMPVRLEGQRIRAQQPAQQWLALGQDAEDLRRGKGDVQEEADARFRRALADHLGHQHELVVVGPDEIALPMPAQDRVGEALVGLAVGAPALGREDDARGEAVQQRPQGVVGIAFVERTGDLGGDLHSHVAVLLLPLGHQALAALTLARQRVTRPAQPETMRSGP